MKYWITGLLMLAVLIIGAVYIFIPASVTVAAVTGIRASEDAAYRLLSREDQWQRWWPHEQADTASSQLFYNGSGYTISKKMFRSLGVTLRKNGRSYNSTLILLPIGRDSFDIEWKAELATGSMPLRRYRSYRSATELEHDLHKLLGTLKSFLEKPKNVYGVPIIETKVTDSIILMGTLTGTTQPTTAEIYGMVRGLQDLANRSNAHTTNYPMLNIDSIGSKIVARVGIPLDREVDVKGTDYVIKRIVLGNILISEVRGGPYTSKNARKQVELYLNDHKRESPAIPYESLVVDRSAEPDTSKWVTRIYYPVY